jgi:hypothetical protein
MLWFVAVVEAGETGINHIPCPLPKVRLLRLDPSLCSPALLLLAGCLVGFRGIVVL